MEKKIIKIQKEVYFDFCKKCGREFQCISDIRVTQKIKKHLINCNGKKVKCQNKDCNFEWVCHEFNKHFLLCPKCSYKISFKNLKNCLICEKKLINKQKKFCSQKCRDADYYRKNKKHCKEKTRDWEEKNPEKRKINSKKALNKFRKNNPEKWSEYSKKYYNKDKKKWRSRGLTYKIIYGKEGFKKKPILHNQCKICGSIVNLEIHHEIYPIRVKDVKNAIDNGKIYYLCRYCHRCKKSNKITNNFPKSK